MEKLFTNLKAFFIVLLALYLFHVPAFAETDVQSAFKQQIITAQQSKNIDNVKPLFYLDGVTLEVIKMMEFNFQAVLGSSGDSLAFEPLPADFKPEKDIGGIIYHPTLTPVGQVSLKIQQGSASLTSFLPYGEHNGK